MRTRLIGSLLLITLPFLAFAQKPAGLPDPGYPKDYFRNPLDIPIFLAGNFGECRPGHFHSGVDIKTLGEENQPVHAAAEGYISRIKMEKGGFGHGLYITHPNGYTTLYAHLNKFAPEIQKYVQHEQYEKKQWDVDLQLLPTQFPVKKGQQVAWSGNTGASTAPHLHFEIRNTKTEHPLNPELFGLPLIDKVPPVPTGIVLYKAAVYESDPLFISVSKRDGIYVPGNAAMQHPSLSFDTIPVTAGVTGIGVIADDYMEGSDNTITFYSTELYMDDSLQSKVILDDIGYEETRYINAYTDYRTKARMNKWVQCLFQLPGNRLDHIFHNLNNTKGRLDLMDMKIHKVSIILTDDKGNVSKVVFYVKPTRPYSYPEQTGCTPFYANKPNTFSNPGIAFTLDERQLYDDICFRFTANPDATLWSDKYSIHTADVPVHHYFELQVKPNRLVPAELRNKLVMMYTDDKDEDGRAAPVAEDGWCKAKVRNFGTYWLDIDTIPPVIRSQLKNNSNLSKAKRITFEVKDDKTSVKSFIGYLDGKWLCFEQHGNTIFYDFDAHCPKGKHKLVFKAEDENGNVAGYTLNFVR